MPDTMVDARGVEKFLSRLGQCFRRPATLYLVGGTSLLLVAGKTSTFDIEIQCPKGQSQIDDAQLHVQFNGKPLA